MSAAIAASAWSWAAWAFAALALAGCGYTLYAVACVRRFVARSRGRAQAFPGVTQLKPVAAAEIGLEDNLRSFSLQDYGGPLQMLLGVPRPSPAQGAADTGAMVPRLMDAMQADGRRQGLDPSARRVDLVECEPNPACANPKIAKLVQMAPHAVHEVLVLSDSDIVAGQEDLAVIVGELYQPRVGAVTCLYRGLPRAGVWSRLAAMQIDHHFLPSVLAGEALGLAHPCMGSTIALSRATLERIGGFAAFADHLADDHAIGAAVRGQGLAVALSRVVVGHACSETSLRALLQHELRWARTVRALDPAGHAGSVIAHPVPLAALALALALAGGGVGPGAGVAAAVLLLALACRARLRRAVDGGLQIEHHRAWLAPLRDMLSFSVFVASFFVGAVTWRGRRYRVASDGTVVALAES